MGYQTVQIDGVRISEGNSKLRSIPNISTAPCRGCRPDAPCKRECYAIKAYRQYDVVRRAWNENLRVLQTAPERYHNAIDAYCQRYRPAFFRWYVSGDIMDQNGYNAMVRIARRNPQTRFLCFTKRHELSFHRRPDNLQIVLSMWPQWGNTRKRLRRVWYQDGTETRVPTDAIHCPGNCESCGACFSLEAVGKDVVFNKH